MSLMRYLRIAAGFALHKIRAMTHGKPDLLTAGMVAPEFDLRDKSGKRHRLIDYRGKKVVLWFFLRAMTPG